MSTIAPPRTAARRHGRAPRPSTRNVPRLGTYTDDLGRLREVVCVPGALGTRLVIDRVCDPRSQGGDERRLLAHLAADEPTENARLVGAMYLAQVASRRCRCVTDADVRSPFGEGGSPPEIASNGSSLERVAPSTSPLLDRRGTLYRLETMQGALAIRELRWCRRPLENGRAEPVSVRAVIGALEAYEPALSLTASAVRHHEANGGVSVALLRAEHQRASESPIVLNRRLREVVAESIARGEVTASEIAIRCGRVRRGPRGAVSGETTWLMRRIGQVAEAGRSQPTPWIHSDVLALIAREGLSLNPNDVEL